MPGKVLVLGVCLVILIVLFTFLVQFIPPLSAKSSMNTLCREALFRMEAQGGLQQSNKDALVTKLQEKGFENIIVTAPAHAARGESVTLRVEADFPWRTFMALFSSRSGVQHMVYERTLVCRNVINE